MRQSLIVLFFTLTNYYAQAQDTTLTLRPDMFSKSQQIVLASKDGWLFHEGNNPNWATPGIDLTGWKAFKPQNLSVKNADPTGKVEGWFRLTIKLDSAFKRIPIGFRMGSWAAIDLYVDGVFVRSYGNTGSTGKPHEAFRYPFKIPDPINLSVGNDHLIALHLVDYVSPVTGNELMSAFLGEGIISLTGPAYNTLLISVISENRTYYTLWMVVELFITLLFWLLSFQQLYEKRTIRLITTLLTVATVAMIGRFALLLDLSYLGFYFSMLIIMLSIWWSSALSIITLIQIFNNHFSRKLVLVLFVVYTAGALVHNWMRNDVSISIAILVDFIVYIYLIIVNWRKLKGAQWAIVVGLVVTIIVSVAYSIIVLTKFGFSFNLIFTGVTLSLPISFLVYVAIRFKEIVQEARDKAVRVTQISLEKQQILANQNNLLEQQVRTRTTELQQSLTDLQATQTQLIQKEKLASLGELTAGIAHEIQNPLNFVNNFSEVSTELVSEMEEEQQKPDRDTQLEAELLSDLKQNLQKITHHGGRASAIVKGMLEHSRASTGEKQTTNLNQLADEYLRLAYHGHRAKNKDFNAQLITDFDPNLGEVNLVAQDMGRVLLNLYNNAFYAVQQRQLRAEAGYEPTVWVSTRQESGQVAIRVRDNGTGIPPEAVGKIFQPFFTTKPTGEGTGLGLSLSYDIITKGHGGALEVQTKEGEGTTFIVTLPKQTN